MAGGWPSAASHRRPLRSIVETGVLTHGPCDRVAAAALRTRVVSCRPGGVGVHAQFRQHLQRAGLQAIAVCGKVRFLNVIATRGPRSIFPVVSFAIPGPQVSIHWIFEYIDATRSSTALRESLYVFPIVEGLHVVSLAFSVGLVMWFDLRLAGWILKDQPVSAVFPAVASFHTDGIRHHVRNRELTLLVAGDALLWQPLFLGQSTHAGARGRQYRGVPPDDRPPSNRMERGADSALAGANRRTGFAHFVGRHHRRRPHDGLLFIV